MSGRISRRGLKGLLARAGLIAAALGTMVGLGFAAHDLARAGADAAAVGRALVCGTPHADPGDCVREQQATVTSKASNLNRQPDRLVVDLAGRDVRVDFDHGSGFLKRVDPGDRLAVESWRGAVITVTDAGVTGRTRAHPESAYHRDKAVAIFLAGLALFFLPIAAISTVRAPGVLAAGHAWLVFLVVFVPLSGITLMAAAGSMADGLTDAGTYAIPGAVLALVAGFAGWCARRSRRGARDRAAEAAVEAARVFGRRGR